MLNVSNVVVISYICTTFVFTPALPSVVVVPRAKLTIEHTPRTAPCVHVIAIALSDAPLPSPADTDSIALAKSSSRDGASKVAMAERTDATVADVAAGVALFVLLHSIGLSACSVLGIADRGGLAVARTGAAAAFVGVQQVAGRRADSWLLQPADVVTWAWLDTPAAPALGLGVMLFAVLLLTTLLIPLRPEVVAVLVAPAVVACRSRAAAASGRRRTLSRRFAARRGDAAAALRGARCV